MSLKQDSSVSYTQDDIIEPPTKDLGSENGCRDTLSDSDSESVAGLQRRRPRVGLRGGRNRQHTLAEKFAARVTVGAPDECWLIAGADCNQAGHAQITIGSPARPPFIRVLAHRFAWEQANGRKVPPGLVVMHSCDRPKCCNPLHLSLGTQHDNILDSVRKGRYNCFGQQKLNAQQVLDIRAMADLGILQKDIALQFGIARNTVSAIVNRKAWTHLDAPVRTPA